MKQLLLAGFGGQGILFAGKFLATLGVLQGKEVSWLPSYGPEMRGGTANCSVIVSDEPIGSPLVSAPDVLVCMNLPSLDKFEGSVPAGGLLFVDSALAEREVDVPGVQCHRIPATRLAEQNELTGLANMIMCGHVIRHAALADKALVHRALEQIVPAGKEALLKANLRAVDIGHGYEAENGTSKEA